MKSPRCNAVQTSCLVLFAWLLGCGGDQTGDIYGVPARLSFIRHEQGAADGRFDLTHRAASRSVHGDHSTLGDALAIDGAALRVGRHLALTFAAIGRDGAMRDIAAPGDPEVAANRVTVPHGASLRQWWLNGPLGLEQGFEVAVRPLADAAGELVLRVEVAGAQAVSDGAGGVQLLSPGSAPLRYTDLFAEDANGTQLVTEMRPLGRMIELRIDDRGARYPLQIDPLLWSETAKLLGSAGVPSDLFGFTVAVSGDYAVIGAPQELNNGVHGTAYIYERDGTGQWIEQPVLDADTPIVVGNQFGQSVAISGDYAFVGAPLDAAFNSHGAVYVYERDGAGLWVEQPALISTNGGGLATFGTAVAVDGDYAVIGADFDPTQGTNAGAVYFFERDVAGTWNDVIKLYASDAANEDHFGETVAISGDYAIVGSIFNTVQFSGQGAAYIFERSGAGVWSEKTRLVASDASGQDGFGISVSIDGDWATVGSWHDDDNGSDAGAVYVFMRDAAGDWNEQAKLTASDGAGNDNFGFASAISGNHAIVGSPFDGFNRGGAYIFERDLAGVWTEQPKLTPMDADNGDQFGSAVAMDGAISIVGARADEDDAGFLGGSAYVFEGAIQPGDPGAPCATTGECLSGFCVDGVCCDSACGDSDTSDCQACSIAAGGTTDGSCSPLAAGSVCRAMAGACDVEEQCDGTAAACPTDALSAAGTTCRAAAGDCDAEESCSGSAADCPPDLDAPDGSTCDNGVCTDGTCNPAAQQGGGGGAGGQEASGGSGVAEPEDDTSGDGCSCHVVGHGAGRAAPWFLGAFLALGLRRRRTRG